MGKSKRLRLRDVRDALRLIGECRDFGADVLAWREHLLRGLCRLLDAQVAVGAEVRIAQNDLSALTFELVSRA